MTTIIVYYHILLKISCGFLYFSHTQENKWGLEDLELYLDIGGDHIVPGITQDVLVSGLFIQGAAWSSSKHELIFSDELAFALPPSKLKWRLKSLKDQQQGVVLTSIPVYTGESRKNLVCQVLVGTAHGVPAALWTQRSVAIILQAPLN